MAELALRVQGGAGPAEAAAVAAVVAYLLEVEEAARSLRPSSNLAPAWVRAGWPRPPDPGSAGHPWLH